VCPREPPRDTREEQGDAHLHPEQQERVVVGARRERVAHVQQPVDAERQAAARDLGRQCENRERGDREEALVAARPAHRSMIPLQIGATDAV